jgi:ABC-type uncharacterized transport system involved in gliding motility auxiliary subunit
MWFWMRESLSELLGNDALLDVRSKYDAWRRCKVAFVAVVR